MSLADRISQFAQEFEARNRANLHAAADLYRETLVEVLGVQGDPKHPSRPGEAPHRVTGTLQASAFAEVDESSLSFRAGTAAGYGKYLADRRPYPRIALERCRSRLRALLLGR